MSNDDRNGRLATEVILKLFDTLKESSKDVKTSVEKQTDAIVHLSSLLKEGVTLDEIKKIIDEHNIHSGKHLDDIDTCAGTIEDNSTVILQVLKGLSKKVSTMIIVVVVTFALMAISYLFVSNSVETIIKNKIEESIKTEETYMYDPSHNELLEQIEKIKKQMEKLNQNKDAGE